MNDKASTEYPTEGILLSKNGGKGNQVRDVFDNTARYLSSRRVDILFRIHATWTYATRGKRERVLDIGCGDGSISLQLLDATSRLTLMDLSLNMLARAKANMPCEFAENVEMRNENFALASFDSEPFDLIVAVGVMAHVDSPDAFLEKIKGLLPPGGHLILEFTDAYHFIGRLDRCWDWIKEIVAPARYPTNKLSFEKVAKVLERHQLKLESVFRYSRVPIPGFNRLVSRETEYALVKALFGSCAHNSNAWLGNEYICLLTSE
jgi:SAM-dependent methyltransferase